MYHLEQHQILWRHIPTLDGVFDTRQIYQQHPKRLWVSHWTLYDICWYSVQVGKHHPDSKIKNLPGVQKTKFTQSYLHKCSTSNENDQN